MDHCATLRQAPKTSSKSPHCPIILGTFWALRANPPVLYFLCRCRMWARATSHQLLPSSYGDGWLLLLLFSPSFAHSFIFAKKSSRERFNSTATRGIGFFRHIQKIYTPHKMNSRSFFPWKIGCSLFFYSMTWRSREVQNGWRRHKTTRVLPSLWFPDRYKESCPSKVYSRY